jgi:hypothetical protein
MDEKASNFGSWVKHLTFLGALGVIGYLGEKGGDGGFIKDIWAALKTASPPVAMVLFVLFWDERRERRDAQKQCNDRTVDFIQSTNLQTATAGKASDALTNLAHGFETIATIMGLKFDKGRGKKR